MSVFVIDRNGKPLMPCTEKRARLLLARGRARVHRAIPFAIRLVDRAAATSALQPLRLKLDPGSKFTGMALVRDAGGAAAVVGLYELEHRGAQISKAMTARSNNRRGRRGRNTRYRAPRFMNRAKARGWMPPSLRHRVETAMTWVRRFATMSPLHALSMEAVRIGAQVDQSAVYQPGTLAGYEVKEYLLDKWGRKCIYCDAQDRPLQIEHIVARANGGSDRISNLALACGPCNNRKAARSVLDFLKKDPARLARIMAQLKRSLRDTAAVHSTRSALLRELQGMGVPVETASGALTKYNRGQLGIPKTHALDAACVGQVKSITMWRQPTLAIKSTGRGEYRRTQTDKHGFPRGHRARVKRPFGFQTGDIVRANAPAGKYAGKHFGRVIVRMDGYMNIGKALANHKHCTLVQRADGYSYQLQPAAKAAQPEQA